MQSMRPFIPGTMERKPLTTQEMSEWRNKVVKDLVKQDWSVEEANALFDEALEK
jgi:hypothetical protein